LTPLDFVSVRGTKGTAGHGTGRRCDISKEI